MKSRVSTAAALLSILVPTIALGQVRGEGVQVAYATEAERTEARNELLDTPARLEIEDIPLVQALQRLQHTSGVPVAYSPSLLPAQRLVSCHCAESSVGEALRTILHGVPFDFVVAAQQLVIRQRPDPEVPVATVAVGDTWGGFLEPLRVESVVRRPPPSAQGTLTGQVLTATGGLPLADVQVSIPTLDIGTLSNESGRFLIPNVPVGQHEISAQRIGYTAATEVVDVTEGATTIVNFSLQERAISMEGLVITGVAAETPQSQVPFTVESVAVAELQRVTVPSVAGLLQGKVAGVKVVQGSGLPGSEPSFQFRGPTSISGSQDPLVVIDGVITQGGIADINTQDIQSMEVVKGAAAAALYGSRAQAGVLQITTKSGAGMQEGANQFTLRTTYESHDIEHYMGVNGGHPYQMDAQGNFLAPDGSIVDLPAEGRAIAFDDGADGTQANSAFADNEFPPPTFDPMRQFYNPGARVKTNASLRGNIQGTEYFVSGAYTREEGPITLLDPMEERQARLNLTQPIGEDFRLKLTSYLSDRTRHVTEEQGGFVRQLTFTTRAADLLRPDPDEPGGISAIGDPIDVGNVSANPVNRLVNTTDKEDRTRFMGSVDASYNPVSWLTVSGNLSYDRIDADRLTYQRPGLSNQFGAPPTVGSISQADDRREELNASLTLAYNRVFGDLTMRNRFRWLAERREESGFEASGSGLAVDETPRLGLVTGTPEIDSYSRSVRSEGFFLINQFSYRDRYIGDFLIRRDGSSLFGEDSRWQTYGRVSAAWRISQEPWFNVGWITELKPRYSIGTSGGRPAFDAQYETFAVDRGQIIPTTLGNDGLKPELATEQEFGVDAVFADRLQITVNYVDTKVEDQLLLVPLASNRGFEAQWQNAGTLESNTWEASVEAAIIDRPGMRWTARVTADRTRNEITELNRAPFEVTNPGLSRSRMLVQEGETLGSFYGFEFLSSCNQFTVPMPCDEFAVNDLGHLVWVGTGNNWDEGIAKDLWGTSGTVNGQVFRWGFPIRPGIDSPLAFTKLGESQPDLNLGIRQDFEWGNFGASVLLDGEWGAQIYNFSMQWQCRDWHCAEADMRGVPDEKKKPITYFGALQAANNPNNYFAEDADYVKLREVSLRYTLPQSLLRGPLSRVQEATLNLTGRNLKTWTDYRGFDPEVGTNTFGGSAVVGRVDEWFVPNFRSIGFDVELVF